MKVFFSRPAHLTLILASLIFAFAFSEGAVSAFAQESDTDDEAIAFFNKGQDAHEKGDLKAALVFYDKALKVIPTFPEVELQRGNVFLTLGQMDDAEAAFRRAVELREDWTLALAALGDVLVRKTKYPEAETVLAKAIELDELNYPAYAAITELKLRTNATREEKTRLLAILTALTSKVSPTSSIWAARGALENSLGDRTAARSSVAAALKLEPKNVSALSESAVIALAENDPGEAAVFVSRLEAISPTATSVKLLRARVLYANGDSDGAVKVLADAGTSSEVESLRNEIVAQTATDPAELEKQLAADSKSGPVLGKLCSMLRVKDPMKALDFCRRAVSAEPSKIENAIGFGAALIQAKRFDDAILVFRKLVPSAPGNSTIRANLATALFFSKRYAEAKVEYRWLTDHQPNLAAAYYFLAIAHDQLGEYADAMANYQQFLRLADAKSSVEIEKVNLRLPGLQKQVRNGKGKRNY